MLLYRRVQNGENHCLSEAEAVELPTEELKLVHLRNAKLAADREKYETESHMLHITVYTEAQFEMHSGLLSLPGHLPSGPNL